MRTQSLIWTIHTRLWFPSFMKIHVGTSIKFSLPFILNVHVPDFRGMFLSCYGVHNILPKQ